MTLRVSWKERHCDRRLLCGSAVLGILRVLLNIQHHCELCAIIPVALLLMGETEAWFRYGPQGLKVQQPTALLLSSTDSPGGHSYIRCPARPKAEGRPFPLRTRLQAPGHTQRALPCPPNNTRVHPDLAGTWYGRKRAESITPPSTTHIYGPNYSVHLHPPRRSWNSDRNSVCTGVCSRGSNNYKITEMLANPATAALL